MIFLWALLINSHVLAAESEFHANRAETENVLQVGDNEELVDRWVTSLTTGSTPQIRQTLAEIVLNPLKELLPRLLPLMEKNEGRTRQVVTMLVIEAFPAERIDFFSSCLESETVYAREAAVYGLARTPDAQVLDLIVTRFSDESPVVRSATLRALQTLVRPPSAPLFDDILGEKNASSVPLHPGALNAQNAIRKALKTPVLRNDLRGLWTKLADVDSCIFAQSYFLNAPEQSPYKSEISKLLQHSNRWLGKPKSSSPIAYQFSMINVPSGSSKVIDIDATAEEIKLTRLLEYHLDRVIHLRLAADLWIQAPSLFAGSVSVSEDRVEVEFDLTGAPSLYAGVGALNISYWEGRPEGAQTAKILFDKSTGRFLSESILDSLGNEIWVARVSEWLGEGIEKPAQLIIRMPSAAVGAMKIPLKVTANFTQNSGNWILTDAESVSDLGNGKPEEIKARAEVQVKTSASAQRGTEPAAEPAAEPVGEASTEESDSGQGSTAGSPRE